MKIRASVRIVGLLMLLSGVLSACAQEQAVVIPQTTVTLYYDENGVVIHNSGANPMTALEGVQFARGAADSGGDDYVLSRIPNGSVPPSACYRLVRNRNQTPMEIDTCSSYLGNEVLPDVTSLFWRAEPIEALTFDIVWQGTVLRACPTVNINNGGVRRECIFVYPPNPS